MRFQKCFRKKKQEMKPGAILDQVISQSSSSANRCLLYKIANYKRGGDLIDAIQSRGNIAVEQLIREKFGIFTYKNGKGQMINRAEFLRWKYRDNHEVVIPIEASLSQYDPLGKWEDHKACWQMQYRGSLGESLLHVLIICDTKIHTKLARILLRVFPMLALDVIEGEEYLGASALHLAIAYSNNELVADLVEAGANINQRAIGSFFLPRDQQRAIPVKNTDYEGLAYLGEYPLAWAACCANESVYNLLLDSGADPDAQDSFGNMILHMVVICDKLDMFGYALRHPKIPARNGMVNFAGLTPLTLACKLGRAEVFREMLELSAREFWRYSNITCSGYPLNALDTLLPDGRTNWNSALFIILNGTKEEHLDMLDGGIIQRLLEEKWKTFARNQFLKRLMILFMHLLFLSISVYLRPITENLQNQESNDNKDEKDANNDVGNDNDGDDNNDMDVRTIIRYCSELATIGGVLSYVIFQQGDEVKNQGFSAFLKQLLHDPAKAIFLVSNLLLLACIPFRIMGDVNTEEAILLFAVPGSWFLLMFFAGAVRLTGPFVTMIYSMLSGDMFTFGIIYTIVLFGFSQAFYFLFKGHSQVENTLFSSYPSTWMALFQTTLGDYNYPDLNNTSYPNLAKTVFVIFMIFVPILLLNMLIAMMGNTYAHVIEQSEKEWMKQWAKIVVTLERAVPQTDAQKYLEQYSIPLGQRDDSGFEQRGVMVIKSKSKTRAKQRKGAVTNWKRVGRVTLNELHKRGMTGEELRRIMWGRSSITSPTKIAKKKPKDAYNVIGAPNNALGTAVDIMSFTHDIVLCNKDPEKLPETVTTIKKKNVKNSASITTKDSKKIINNQPTATVKKEISTATQPPIQPDPLRELVIISEMVETTNNDYISNVKQLATQATALVDDKMITTTKSLPEEKNETEIPTLTTIFQDPATMVDPEKERKFLQKLEELNDTEDSEGFVERPILGKISLARRAKSAVARTPSSRARINESEIPSATYTWNLQNTVQINDEINKEEKSQQQNDNDDDDDDDNNDDNEEVTIEDVKRKTAEFHLKHRIAPPKSRSQSARNGRYKRHRNKISPENTTDFDNTAEKSDDRREESMNDVSKLQDPLEPWSTRNITNINEILGLK